jgi:hypothetical protein
VAHYHRGLIRHETRRVGTCESDEEPVVLGSVMCTVVVARDAF